MAENPDDVLHVEGGKPLNGTIKVRGAKNFVSKAMVAALLAPGKSVLKNVPEIRDVHVVSDLLRLHGVDVDVDGANGIVTIDASRVQLADVADVDTLSGSSRIPILFSGPSDVHGISLIDRGYADFRGKLEALGADFD